MPKVKILKIEAESKLKTKKVEKFFAHQTAFLEDGLEIGDNTKIWHYSQIRHGTKIGTNCIIGNSVFIDFDSVIGNNVKIQNRAIIYHQAIIGNGVFVGPNVCFTNDRIPRAINPDGTLKSGDDWEVSTITIKDGASIGGHSVITPGVTIGSFALIGSGSVVSRDVPDFALAYGNPARVRAFVCKCGKKLKNFQEQKNQMRAKCVCGIEIKINKEIYNQWQTNNPDQIVHPAWNAKNLPSENIATMLSYKPEYYSKRLLKIGFQGAKTKLLDAGCGAGHWAIAASYLNKEVKGIDSTEKYLSVARDLKKNFMCENLDLVLGKMENLPYKDNYFDYVVSYCVWMYTDREKSLKEMYRVLKPGGKIYLGAVTGFGWYLKLIIEGLMKGNRSLILLSLGAIRRKIQTNEKDARRYFAKLGFKILALGSDGALGDKEIQVTPIYSPKILGFWNVYEILAQKVKKKGKNEN